MKVLANISSKSLGFYLVFLVITSVGVYLRLDQFTLQVLLDDEWHVIHRLLVKTPKELFQSFGPSDYSIPLALLYWSQLKLFGLSETGMRWPMMLAGISTLVLFPLYVRKFIDDKATLMFSFLLAISPVLILYSRTARPYALTLFLSLLALGAFHKFVGAEKTPWKSGLVYAVCAVTSVWLHLISLPMIVAPFLALGLPALLDRDWSRIRRMLWLGISTAVGMLALVLPPLLGHPETLSAKLGVQTPDLQTYYGLLYVWLGTSSLAVVLIGLLLAAAGRGRLWRRLPLLSSLITGLGLTLGVILLSQPASVHHSLTLARYLLPVIPLFLLAIALGVSRLSDALIQYWGRAGILVSWAGIMSVLLLIIYYSPLPKFLAKPNSNSLHTVYQADFREEQNVIAQYQQYFPISPFWNLLASLPRDSVKIVASPFYFESFHWDAARREQISHQRVMPGYLTGVCVEHRWGEVPMGHGFRFQNVGYLGDPNDLIKRGFDLVVYQKPVKVMTNQGEVELGKDTTTCEKALRELYREPVYQDEWLVVFPLSDSLRGQINAAR